MKATPICKSCRDIKGTIDGNDMIWECRHPARCAIDRSLAKTKKALQFIIDGTIGRAAIFKGIKAVIKTSPMLCPRRDPRLCEDEAQPQ